MDEALLPHVILQGLLIFFFATDTALLSYVENAAQANVLPYAVATKRGLALHWHTRTGFLGAGKTTLVKHLLKNKAGLKIAVIVNDMAQLNFDKHLVAKTKKAIGCFRHATSLLRPASSPFRHIVARSTQKTGCLPVLNHARMLVYDGSEENVSVGGGQVLELANGCLCCNLRGDLMMEVNRLAEQKTYDYVLALARLHARTHMRAYKHGVAARTHVRARAHTSIHAAADRVQRHLRAAADRRNFHDANGNGRRRSIGGGGPASAQTLSQAQRG